MALQHIAPELVYEIFNTLSTVADVINLSLTCKRFHKLLRSAHKLSTLFAAADRQFGPIEDIKMIVTFNHSIPAHLKRDPPLSYPLLRQILSIGLVGKRFEHLYPSMRWESDFLQRRSLTSHEAYLIRRALYRYWLYSVAFHNRLYPRRSRLQSGVVEERCRLLRNWSNIELIEIEDVRLILEDMLTFHVCPTDGDVRARTGKDNFHLQWHHQIAPPSQTLHCTDALQKLFHNAHDDIVDKKLPASQSRVTKMEGWGDDISQYHTIQSMMKLNPAQIIWLYDNAVYKWQVEAMTEDMGDDWFWNNGQTFSDTWSLVLQARGQNVDELQGDIINRICGAIN